MSVLKEKLKQVGKNVSAITEWVGSHLGTLLTIFSAVAAFLFLRERKARQSAETSLELKDQENVISNLKKEVEDDEETANDSLNDYNDERAERAAPRKRKLKKQAARKRR